MKKVKHLKSPFLDRWFYLKANLAVALGSLTDLLWSATEEAIGKMQRQKSVRGRSYSKQEGKRVGYKEAIERNQAKWTMGTHKNRKKILPYCNILE